MHSNLDLGRGDLEKFSNYHKVLKNICDYRLRDNIEDLLEILKNIH